MAYFDSGLTSAAPLFWQALAPLIAALLVGPWAAVSMVLLVTAGMTSFYLCIPTESLTGGLFEADQAQRVALSSAIASSVFAASVGCAYEVTRRRIVAARDTALRRLQASNEKLRAAHSALHRKDTALQEAQRISGIGTWYYDLDSHTTYWSDEHKRLFNYPVEEPAPSHRAFLTLIYPEDRDGADRALVAAAKTLEATSFNFRVEGHDGRTRAMRTTAKVVCVSSDDTGEKKSHWLVGVTRDITRERAHKANLVQAKENAEASARLKDTIFANLNHEMRTPISSICGLAAIIAEEAEGTHREFAEMIHRSGTRLGTTLNALLDLADLEAGHVQEDVVRIDAAKEIEKAARELEAEALRKGLTFAFNASHGDGRPATRNVWLDRTSLHRVIGSIVANAVKFTETGGVQINVVTEAESLRIRVGDTGRGISEGFLPKLYEPFQQESDGLSRSHSGVGLGLTVAHRLVKRMGGTITVESTLGEGSTFTVELPYLRAAAPLSDAIQGSNAHTQPALPVLLQSLTERSFRARPRS